MAWAITSTALTSFGQTQIGTTIAPEEIPTKDHLVRNLLLPIMGTINNRDSRGLEEGAQRCLEQSNLDVRPEQGDSPVCMCHVPDVGNDFLPGDTGKRTTILCTTFEEIRETITPRFLLPRSQKIATLFSAITRSQSGKII